MVLRLAAGSLFGGHPVDGSPRQGQCHRRDLAGRRFGISVKHKTTAGCLYSLRARESEVGMAVVDDKGPPPGDQMRRITANAEEQKCETSRWTRRNTASSIHAMCELAWCSTRPRDEPTD